MIGSSSTIDLGHQHAHKTQVSQLGHHLYRKPCFAIPFRCMGREPRPSKVAGDIAQHTLLVGELHAITLNINYFEAGGFGIRKCTALPRRKAFSQAPPEAPSPRLDQGYRSPQ
jgi:hypothetical protein